jgi:hypothetical protein
VVAAPAIPELPRVILNTDFTPAPCTVTVASFSELQSAVDAASYGAVICLKPGITYPSSLVLPKKTGTGWIVIRSAAPDSSLPAPGTRTSPSFSPVMPKLIPSPVAGPAIQVASGAHGYRLVGLEVAANPVSRTNFGLIEIGNSLEPVLSNVPSDIIVDRCYIHGLPANSRSNYWDTKRGIALSSARTAVIDSYISEIHVLGQEAQAIGSWNGPGPFKIVNNYLEGAGENILFGGAPPAIPGMVPVDIEIRKNHFYKRLAWCAQHPFFAGVAWTVKNMLEFKFGKRILVEGNVFQNNWDNAQRGFAIVITARPNDSGPAAVIEDVTVRNNIIHKSQAGVNTLALDDLVDPGEDRGHLYRVTIENNLFDEIGWQFQAARSPVFQILRGPQDLVLVHNTAMGRPLFSIVVSGEASTGTVIVSNLITYAGGAIFGDGKATGMPAIEFYLPESLITGNLFPGRPVSAEGTHPSLVYPPGNFFTRTFDEVGFVDWQAANFQLNSQSAFRSIGLDRTGHADNLPVGVNFDVLLDATRGVVQTPPETAGSFVNQGNLVIRVYPNPWRSDRHADRMITFTGLNAGGVLKIFTVSGYLVRTLDGTGLPLTWDRKNKSGQYVGSGLYLFVATDGEGNRARGQLAIIK